MKAKKQAPKKMKAGAPTSSTRVRLVVVRTYGAGVHIGELVSQCGQVVTLRDARRLWRWRGANTLNEVATRGVSSDYTRVSEPAPSVVLTTALEVIDVADAARASLTSSQWPS